MANRWWETDVDVNEGPEEYSRRVGIIRQRRESLGKEKPAPPPPVAPEQQAQQIRQMAPVQKVVTQPTAPEVRAQTQQIAAARETPVQPSPITPPKSLRPPPAGFDPEAWEWVQRIGADYIGSIQRAWQGEEEGDADWWQGYRSNLQRAMRQVQDVQEKGQPVDKDTVLGALGSTFLPAARAGLQGLAGLGEAGETAFGALAIEGRRKLLEKGLVTPESGMGFDPNEYTIEEMYPAAREIMSLMTGREFKAWQAPTPEEAGLGDLLQRYQELGGRETAYQDIRDAVSRIRSGEDPQNVMTDYYDISADVLASAMFDPLIGLDALEMFGLGSKVSHRGRTLAKSTFEALDQLPGSAMKKLDNYADEVYALWSGEFADATEALARTMDDITPIKRNAIERVLLTDEAQVQRAMSDAYESLATNLMNLDSLVGEGEDLSVAAKRFLTMMRDAPEELAERMGRQVVAQKGNTLTSALRILGEQIEDMPSLVEGAYSPGELVRDFLKMVEDPLKRAYGVSDRLSRNPLVRLANWQRGIISELFLNAYLRPGYAIQNMLSDSANLIFDGVNPVKGRDFLENFDEIYGPVSTRVSEGLGPAYKSLYNISPESSALPGFVPGRVRQFTKKGVNLARKYEEGRVARTFADQVETALEHLQRQSPPELSRDLAILGEDASYLLAAVRSGRNRAEKLEGLERFLRGVNRGSTMDYSSFVSQPEMRRALPPDFFNEIGRRIEELGPGATLEQAQEVVRAYGEQVVRRRYGQRMASLGQLRPSAHNAATTEVDDVLGVMDDLASHIVAEGEEGLAPILRSLDSEAARVTQEMTNAHTLMGQKAAQIGTPEARDLVVMTYQNINENRRLMRQMEDSGRRVVMEVIEATPPVDRRAVRKAEWARYYGETLPDIWRQFTRNRLEELTRANERLDQLAQGLPWEQVVPERTRMEVASDDMLRLANRPPRVHDYVPGPVDLRNWDEAMRYYEGERAFVDDMMNVAWNEAAMAPPEDMAAVMDTIYAATRDVGWKNKQTAAMVADLLEELQTGSVGRTAAQRSDDWQKFRLDAQKLWRDAREEQMERWMQAADQIRERRYVRGPANSSREAVEAAQAEIPEAGTRMVSELDAISANAAQAGAVGDVPLAPQVIQAGEADALTALQDIARGIEENWDSAIQPALRGGQIDKAAREWFEKTAMPHYLDQVAVAKQYAGRVTNETMLDYSQRSGIDMVLNSIFPYTFWYTRTGINWWRRLMRRPAILANYLRVRDALKQTNEAAGRRTRFERKIPIRLPAFVRQAHPEWGEYVHVDPISSFIPFATVARWNWDDPEEGATGLRSIFNFVKRYGFRTFPAYDLLYESGLIRKGAMALGTSPEGAEMLGPRLEGDVMYQLPWTGMIQGATATMQPQLEELGLSLPAEGVNIEAWPRQLLGIQRGEFYQPYRVSRMVSNLMEKDPQNLDLARAGLMAAEMADRWEEAKQVGRPWEAGDAIALDFQEEYGLTDQEMADAQVVLETAVRQAAMERLLPTTTSSILGTPFSVEPSGEAFQIGLQRMQEGLVFPQAGGSREELTDFRRAFPAQYVRQASYGSLPGEEEYTGFSPTERANWLAQKEAKDEINARYDRESDDFLRQRLWDTKGYKAIEGERFDKLDAAEARYPTPQIGDDGTPAVLWGMNEDEAWDAMAEKEMYRWQKSEPGYNDFSDYSQYEAAHDKWLQSLPKQFSFGTPDAGTYAGLSPSEAYSDWRQRWDSPLEAASRAYQDSVVSPAWDEYFRLKDAGVGGKERWSMTIGAVPAMEATSLIPNIMQSYPRKWTEEELRQALSGVRVPPMETWFKE